MPTDVRDRMILTLHEQRGHGHDLPTCPVLADAMLTALISATDPGDDPHRRMVEHLGRAWPELTEDPVYLDQLAHEALSVRWEHAAHIAARVGDAERRADAAEGQLSALRDHERRWEAEKTRADQAEKLLDAALQDVERLETKPVVVRSAPKADVEKARKLHQRDDSNPRGPWCPTCTTLWPCLTATALWTETNDALPAARCPSCDHLAEHHQPEGCWYAVTTGAIDLDLVCPCTVPGTALDGGE